MMSLEDGSYLVRLARDTIEKYLKTGKRAQITKVPSHLLEPQGVFVTLNQLRGGKSFLRGCIGFPLPVMPLAKAVASVAISSAVEDPRFPPVKLEEMDNIIIEVTVLTVPERITARPEEYLNEIKVGRDGLIVERGYRKGLLLPQVPIEQDWDEATFLAQTCRKAGLPETAWLDTETTISKFQGTLFEEETPRGTIIERPMTAKGE